MKKLTHLVFCCLVLSGVINAQTYQVGHKQITFHDPARNRDIQSELYYPAATAGENVPVVQDTFPIILFGHGFVMAWSAYSNFWETIVPYGYIMVFPRTEGSISPNHTSFGADLAFLYTQMKTEGTTPASFFYDRVASTGAIMGHSMGGGAAFLAAAGNTQINALITFAAANTTPSSITAAATVLAPTLVFSGQNDCVAPPASHQSPMYDSLASGCKTFISITGGGHCYFAMDNFNCSFGESTCSPQPDITREEQQDAVFDMLLPYLDFNLYGNAGSGLLFVDSLQNSGRITFQRNCVTTLAAPVCFSNCGYFPNPVTGIISVFAESNSQPVIMRIYNLQGQQVFSGEVRGEGAQQVDLSGLSKGVYVLKLLHNDQISTAKIVLQ